MINKNFSELFIEYKKQLGIIKDERKKFLQNIEENATKKKIEEVRKILGISN